MTIVAGYRKMIGLTQFEMAKHLGISEVTYRNKEKGKVSFKKCEMVKFYELLIKIKPNVRYEDIFFTK